MEECILKDLINEAYLRYMLWYFFLLGIIFYSFLSRCSLIYSAECIALATLNFCFIPFTFPIDACSSVLAKMVLRALHQI